jgi:signal transduction histidine kinase
MRRLYLQIYATLVAVLALFALAWSWLWSAAMSPHEQRMFEGIARVAGLALPPPGAPRTALDAALAEVSAALLSDVSVYDAQGRLAGHTGEPVERRPGGDPLRHERHQYVFQIELPDGRTLAARHRYQHGVLREVAASLVLLAAAVAVGAWPLVRRLTGRLERLRTRLDALGEGDLSARVEVEGRDEVAELALRFNRAAERIEGLVEAQRMMLAGASHELRTPLARIRLAAELLAGDARPDLRVQIERDVAELDDGIEELLLASRLESAPGLDAPAPVDLLALVAEEAARTGAEARGEPLLVRGDPRLLRRLVRNLLENAHRHGGGSPVQARVEPGGGGRVRLRVDDAGPGVPAAERERIFAPFYRPPGSRESGSGFGLGLALVRRIARLHAGEARCLERPGGGTRLEVELPATG